MACCLSARSIYLNQYWFIVSWTLRNTLQWKVNKSTKVFCQENVQNSGYFVQAWYPKPNKNDSDCRLNTASLGDRVLSINDFIKYTEVDLIKVRYYNDLGTFVVAIARPIVLHPLWPFICISSWNINWNVPHNATLGKIRISSSVYHHCLY